MSRLGLGGALFGRSDLAQGRTPMSEAQAFATLALAVDAGMRLVDTAPVWGGLERLLGRLMPTQPALCVVTKTVPLASGGPAEVERRARASLDDLGLERGHALLVHRAADLTGPDGEDLWRRLQRLKTQGLFAAIGFCACACDDPVGLAHRFGPDLIQAPASLLDQRLIHNGAFAAISALGVRLHLRSVFLHGLILKPGYAQPPEAGPIARQLSNLRLALAEAGADPLQASLAFALSQSEAEAVIVGVGSPAQLRAVLAAAAAPPPRLDWAALAAETPCLITPSRCRAA